MIEIQSEDLKVGQIFEYENVFWMKTDYVRQDGYYLCVKKNGYSLFLYPTTEVKEKNIPWREQPDGYEVLYNYIKNLFPIKPQEIYDSEKEK